LIRGKGRRRGAAGGRLERGGVPSRWDRETTKSESWKSADHRNRKKKSVTGGKVVHLRVRA